MIKRSLYTPVFSPYTLIYSPDKILDAWDYIVRSSRSEVFLKKGVLKTCNKFTGERPCRSVISIMPNFIEITLWHGCSPVYLLHVFRAPFPKTTTGWLLLHCHHQKQPPDILCEEKVFLEILQNSNKTQKTSLNMHFFSLESRKILKLRFI